MPFIRADNLFGHTRLLYIAGDVKNIVLRCLVIAVAWTSETTRNKEVATCYTMVLLTKKLGYTKNR